MADQYKYLKREKINGKWRYWYYKPKDDKPNTKTSEENVVKTAANNAKNMLQKAMQDVSKTVSDAKSRTEKEIDAAVTKAKKSASEKIKQVGQNTANSAIKRINESTAKLDVAVDKGSEVINKIVTDEKNIYVTDSSNYKEKLEKVKQTDEWKNIVARKDSEYVKKNQDGTTEYLIDDYLVDKKHPVLDAIGDIIAGRKVDTNEVTMESAVAGIKDYATSAINTGMLAAGLVGTLLTERFKLQQGSYTDEINAVKDTVETGVNYVNELTELSNSTKAKTSTNPESTNSYKFTDENAKKLLDMANTASNASQVKNSVDEGKLVEAVQILLDSDAMKTSMGTNDYYKLAEKTLSNLSEEEIMLINLIYQEAVKSRK